MVQVFSQYVSAKCLLLILLEDALLIVALVSGAKLRFWSEPDRFLSYTQLPDFAWQALLFVVVFQICFYYGDLYNWTALHRRHAQWMSLAQSLGIGCIVLGLLYFAVPDLLIGRGVFFISIMLVVLFVASDRFLLDALWRLAAPLQNTIVLGTGELALTVGREISNRDDLNINLVGFVEPQPTPTSPDDMICGCPILGGADRLQAVVTERGISKIVVAMEDRRGALPIRDLVGLRVQGVQVEDAQTTIAFLTGRVWLTTVRPSWFVFSEGFHRSKLTLIVKRVTDLFFGVVGLILSAPAMALVAVAVALDSKGPVIYRQTRVGKGGFCFELLKFRSMHVNAESGGKAQWAREDDPRVTRVGRVIRKFRLDELPQFINVLRGDMSFVGPRPERPCFVQELRKQISYYDERHSVRPGLTGWAQVQYSYGSCVEDAFKKLEYDLFYLKNMSVLFDCAIVLQTIRVILTGSGAR
jgi:sugar transferase (PEP-CTERM system associated)